MPQKSRSVVSETRESGFELTVQGRNASCRSVWPAILVLLLNEEIKKRDDEINSHKKNQTDALEAKRELETTLSTSKAENERPCKAVIAYESHLDENPIGLTDHYLGISGAGPPSFPVLP